MHADEHRFENSFYLRLSACIYGSSSFAFQDSPAGEKRGWGLRWMVAGPRACNDATSSSARSTVALVSWTSTLHVPSQRPPAGSDFIRPFFLSNVLKFGKFTAGSSPVT